MAKLPTYRRLLARNWEEGFRAVNEFMRTVVSALQGQLTFSENFACMVREVPLDGSYPVYFAWTLPKKPSGAWVIKAREKSGAHVIPSDAIYADWEYTDRNQIQINSVTGISPSNVNPYSITLVVITG
jgi:hypothetical protein